MNQADAAVFADHVGIFPLSSIIRAGCPLESTGVVSAARERIPAADPA